VVGSLAGEGPLLDETEKAELFRLAGTHIASDRAFIADVSAEGVHVAAKLARVAADAGAKLVVSTPPHAYRNMIYGPDSQALFYRALADRSPVPVLIHNSPLINGVDLQVETPVKLSEHPNVAGIIESGTPVARIAQLRAAVSSQFTILTGTEAQVWESLKAGANGAALAFASAAPYASIAIWEAFRTREEEAGIDWQNRILQSSILVTDMYGVPALKHAMDLNGYFGGPPRLPFAVPTAQQRAEIEEAFKDLKG
jgi:4-hydroxy-2-oxoglutarate aldolase